MKYEDETKNRYRSEIEAVSYKDGYTKGFSPRVFKNKFIAFCEQRAVMKAASYCDSIKKVIDIPCGTGKMTNLLSEKYELYVGVDMSYEMIQQIHDVKGLTFIQGDGTAIPFADKSTDLVVSLRLIHRLPSEVKYQFITELSRISSKYIIFSFSSSSFAHRVLLKIKMLAGLVPEKVIAEPIDDYHAFLESRGFRLEKKIFVLPMVSNQEIFLYSALS
jgi:ubiquinone/menaquinone biosynthesis C-methylase UbiE